MKNNYNYFLPLELVERLFCYCGLILCTLLFFEAFEPLAAGGGGGGVVFMIGVKLGEKWDF